MHCLSQKKTVLPRAVGRVPNWLRVLLVSFLQQAIFCSLFPFGLFLVSGYPYTNCLTILCLLLMSTPIRKKRNFKALQLPAAAQSPISPVSEPEPVPIRQAPAPIGPPGGKKRPPPMTLKAPKIPAGTTPANPEDSNLLTVTSGSSSAPNTASPSGRRNTYHATLSSTLANLDMNADVKFDLRNEDLTDLQELGQGNGGSVKKVEHIPTGTIMAKKVESTSLNQAT